jgi:hypothetical protein
MQAPNVQSVDVVPHKCTASVMALAAQRHAIDRVQYLGSQDTFGIAVQPQVLTRHMRIVQHQVCRQRATDCQRPVTDRMPNKQSPGPIAYLHHRQWHGVHGAASQR